MLDKKSLRDLIEATQLETSLSGAVIEKDYYVTQVIHNLADIQNENFRLVFSGGTSLAKAHKIINRMSEDIDFKIQIKNNEFFSRSQLLKELKKFRTQIKNSLSETDLKTLEDTAANEGKYQRIILQYPHAYPTSYTLRPNILLEFTLSDIRLPTEELHVKTIIEGILKRVTLSSDKKIPCASIEETAIEKWVALTRRVAAIERNYAEDDSSLVRHIYDLSVIEKENKIKDNFFRLAHAIISSDGAQFRSQHPEYLEDPGAEIRKSLTSLNNQATWKENYQKFLIEMTYDPSKDGYEEAITIIENISVKIINSLPSIKLGRIAQEINKTDANLTLSENQEHKQTKKNPVLDKNHKSLKNILLKYVNLELERTKLVQEKMSSLAEKNKILAKEKAEEAIQLNNLIKESATQWLQNPEFIAKLDQIKQIKPQTIAQRGGFAAIQKRMHQQEFSKEDIQTVLAKIYEKSHEHARTLTQDRDRGGGRSR